MNKNKNIILSIIETFLANIIIYYVFYIFQRDQDAYFNLNPHPLFLLAIIIGIAYGKYIGLLSVLISTSFYTYVYISLNHNAGELFTSYQYYKYPLIMFWSVFILGSIKDKFKYKSELLRNENDLLKSKYKTLYKQLNLSYKVQDELKKQIISSEDSILNLYNIASKIEKINTEEVYTEITGILYKYLKAKAIAIYTLDNERDYLRLKIRLGNSQLCKTSINLADSNLIKKIVSEKKALRWSDIQNSDFLMGAPIQRDEKIQAVVIIEDMEFDDLSEYSFQIFKLIMDWVNNALSRASYVESLQRNNYIYGTDILNFDAFKKRVKEEIRRKNEYGMKFCLISFKLLPGIDIRYVHSEIKANLRSLDVIGFDMNTNRCYVLLPCTQKDQVPLIKERIEKNNLQRFIVKVNEVNRSLVV